MKRIVSLVLLVMMLIVGTGSVKVEATNESKDIDAVISSIKQEYRDEYYSLDDEGIELELQRISQSYPSEGDILSERDSAIILLDRHETGNRPTPRAGSSSKWYDVYKTQFGVKVNLYGTMKQNIAYIAGSSTFGGTASVNKISGSVKNVYVAIHHTAYGLVGTSAPFVGVLYNGKVSMSKSGNSQTTKMDKNNNYGSILPVYTTMYSSATITTAAGDEFDVYSPTWKVWH